MKFFRAMINRGLRTFQSLFFQAEFTGFTDRVAFVLLTFGAMFLSVQPAFAQPSLIQSRELSSGRVTDINCSDSVSAFSLVLKGGWKLQSSLKVKEDGRALSLPAFDGQAESWYPAEVPGTVVGNLLSAGYFGKGFDPFYDDHFKKLKGKEFDQGWWWRKSFRLPLSEKGKSVLLRLQGLNYRANLFLNGRKIADSSNIVGPMRIIEVDLSRDIIFGKENVLAMEIFQPLRPDKKDGDLAIDYADWIHYPPDYNAGILNDVVIKTYEHVGISYPLVTTQFAPDNDNNPLGIAHLRVTALVSNYENRPCTVRVEGRINDTIRFQKAVWVGALEKKDIHFGYQDFKQLNILHPRIWWPWQYGKPELNDLTLSVITINGSLSSRLSTRFGIRTIASKLISSAPDSVADGDSARLFIVNGRKILIRGAAWSPDIFQRRSASRQEAEIRLYRDMYLNAIRSEGKFEDDHFYDLCDRYGMLVMTGWMCCGAWQYPENWDAAKRMVAMRSDSSLMYWLRGRASLAAWYNGSDMPPTDSSVEREYLGIERKLGWPNPVIASANGTDSKVSGKTGMKMLGPYKWVPPIYWETDSLHRHGGAWGFATEISPGASIPVYENLLKFLPENKLHYNDDSWKYHAGTMEFGSTKDFNQALINRYGKPSDMRDFVRVAQAQNYEGHRAMFEAYALHKYHPATGVIQWMGANPWPSVIWHTFDYYLTGGGTYFGIKMGMEPLHLMYAYGDNGVYIINNLPRDFAGLSARATVYNLDGSVALEKHAVVRAMADSTAFCFKILKREAFSKVYFLRLALFDRLGNNKSINWYWLSKKRDVLNWSKSTWYITPQTDFADFSALRQLGKTKLAVSVNNGVSPVGDSVWSEIAIQNTGKVVAFQVQIQPEQRDGSRVPASVIYSDNFIELAPGEKRVIKCKYAPEKKGEFIKWAVRGWNGGQASIFLPSTTIESR